MNVSSHANEGAPEDQGAAWAPGPEFVEPTLEEEWAARMDAAGRAELAEGKPPLDPAAAAAISYRTGYRDASVDQLGDVARHMARYADAPDPWDALNRWLTARLADAARLQV